jgi:glyoxylase-like metal-dependent hydrolase (beta-lactamase superfamily II)
LPVALSLSLGLLLVTAEARLDSAEAAEAEAQETGKLEQVIPGHYVYSSGARISGVIVTNEGVLVVDALSNEAMAKHERQLIASTIGKPVRYLVSSTFHGNYSLGNVAYPDVMKIGHENYRADLIDMMNMDKMPAAQQAAMLPHQTFKDRMTLYLGGKEIQILYAGKAHTRGDSVVFVPQDRIVYMSEVFFDGRFPFLNSGYVDWIQAIDSVLKLDADIFVPGQGPSTIVSNPRGSREALIRARKVLVDFRDAVQVQIARGATEDQTAAAVVLAQYKMMVGYDQQREVLVRRMYQDLKGSLR